MSSSHEQDEAALATLRDSFRAISKTIHPKSRAAPLFQRSSADWLFCGKEDFPKLWIMRGSALFDFDKLVFHPNCKELNNAIVLKYLMDCLIQLNLQYLQECSLSGTYVHPLYKSGVYYDRTTAWDSIPALYQRGYGDCKSLTAALVAERRFSGKDASAVFRSTRTPKGERDYHILVQTLRGYEDPSKVCGMGKEENGPALYHRRELQKQRRIGNHSTTRYLYT
jgi:hypothetical protein